MPKKTGYPRRVRTFLSRYYDSFGVGKTLRQRLNHWRKQAEAHNRQGETFDTETDLSALEVTNLLMDQFPDIWPQS